MTGPVPPESQPESQPLADMAKFPLGFGHVGQRLRILPGQGSGKDFLPGQGFGKDFLPGQGFGKDFLPKSDLSDVAEFFLTFLNYSGPECASV